MGGGNGAKAAQARERNAKANAKGPTSQLASNAKAMTTQCKICLQTFQSTAPPPQLKQHQEGKHPKQTPQACFPGVTF